MKKQLDMDQKLDEALSKAPDFELPLDFSGRVVRRIEMKKLPYDRRINTVVMLSSVGFLFLAAISFIIFTKSEILSQMLDFGGWAVLIGVMVVFIQVLDDQLVKKKFLRNS